MPKGQLWLNSGRLRELRLAAALSQQELADRAGVSRQTIVRAESLSVAMPSTIIKLAKALDVEYLRLTQ